MVLYKQVNDERIQIPHEEELELRSKWKNEESDRLAYEARSEIEKKRIDTLKSSFSRKLAALGFTREEVSLFI